MVQARAVRNGYNDWTASHTVTVQKGTQSIAWTPGSASGTVGTNLTVNAVTGRAAPRSPIPSPTLVPPAAVFPPEPSPSPNSGSCVVQARAVRTGYNDWTDTHTVTVAKGTQTASWTPGSASGTVGTNLTVNAVTGASGATVTYAVSNAGTTGCSLSTRTLTFTNSGTCVVEASAVRTGYNDWSDTHSITVAREPRSPVGPSVQPPALWALPWFWMR